MDADATRPLGDAAQPEAPRAAARIGQLVGRYVVLGELGEGGGGQVFEAFDTELERKVALKLLRGGAATAAARREARAQAKLDHPAVVSIFDVGNTDEDGQAYIAMELMSTRSFAHWCREATVAQVMGALRQVAAGVRAAHEAGLVHGDIKPSNILRSSRGEPKLSDFGVARALDRTSADLAGTRAFMAPELFAGMPAGPASDQYAFCVTAWQVFHGKHPAATHPSQASTEHGSAPDTAQPGAERTGEPSAAHMGAPPPWSAAGVPKAVREAITRGLDPDPAARWPSMAGLEQALRPPVPTRNRWVAVAIPALAAVTVGGLVAATAGDEPPCEASSAAIDDAWPAEQRTAIARALDVEGYRTVQRRSLQALDDWAAAWTSEVEGSCEATHVERTQSIELLDLRGACYRDALAGFEATAGVLAQTDEDSRAHAHAVVDGLPHLDQCRDVTALKAAPELDEATQAQVQALRAEIQRASALRRAGRARESHAVLDLIAPEVDDVGLPRLRLEATIERAEAHSEAGDKHAAVTLAKQALELSLTHDDNAVIDDSLILLTSLLGHDVGVGAEAAVYAHMLRARTQREDVLPGDLGAALASLALQEAGAGDYDAAIASFERAIEVRAPERGEDMEYTSMLSGLAMSLGYAGRFEEALSTHERALAVRTRLLGERHPLLSHTLDGMSQELRHLGRFEEALQVADQSLRILEATTPVGHNALSSNGNERAQSLAHLGRYEEARDAFEFALAHIKLAYPEGSRGIAIMQMNLAKFIAEEFEDYDQALPLAAEAVRHHGKIVGPRHVEMVVSRIHHGQLMGMAGRFEAGRTEIEQAIELGLDVLPPGHPDLAYGRLRLAQLEMEAQRWDEAERIALEVDASLQADPSSPASLRETATELLARARNRGALPE